MTPLFPTVAVIDSSGFVEAAFSFHSLSHSIVGDYFEYYQLNPRQPVPPNDLARHFGPINAYIVDDGSGEPQALDTMFWSSGEVDTFSFQFVPEPSSLILLLSLIAVLAFICQTRRYKSVFPNSKALTR
jgi:hypothetical protein